MSLKTLIVAATSLLVMSSCYNSDLDLEMHEPMLINTWMHAHEETCDSTFMIFRTEISCDHSDPEGRSKLELKADGSAIYTIESLTDPNRWKGEFTYKNKGTWMVDPETATLLFIDANDNVKFAFKIYQLQSDMMELNYRDPQYCITPAELRSNNR
jgi:hypothetical protein